MSKKRKNGQSTSSASVRRKAHPLTEPGNSVREKYAFLDDFFTYNWQDIPPRHAFGIYALSVFAGFPDYVEIAEVAITEGGDDRGVDFCYLDLDEQRVFIGQSYVAEEWGSEAAPARKADGLLTGLSWLLNSNIDEIPSSIREKAQEIQDA
ncbi:MAG TPA: hypothetical protein PLV92_12985, partial [Pirellulaceae bacterium]|nr:hypothetical protein [Pirellulaceae bacterium]